MYKKPIGISTDCLCDIPFGVIEENEIDMIYYHVVTENGLFLDRDEITADNVFEHMDNGGLKAEAEDPTVEEYKAYFQKNLDEYDKIIHISTSSYISNGYTRAEQALVKLGNAGKNVFLVDSRQISSGLGLLVLSAADLRRKGKEPEHIVDELEKLKQRICTSFMLTDALYLYFNDKVKLRTLKCVSLFRIRPVFAMREGHLKLVWVYIGNYANCARRYIKSSLKKVDSIDKKRIFITHTKANLSVLNLAKKEVKYRGEFKQVIVNKASGSLASEIGPNAFGIIFMDEGKSGLLDMLRFWSR